MAYSLIAHTLDFHKSRDAEVLTQSHYNVGILSHSGASSVREAVNRRQPSSSNKL